MRRRLPSSSGTSGGVETIATPVRAGGFGGGFARAPLPRHPERACEWRAYLLFVEYAATTGGSDGGHSELSTDSIESRKIESLLVPLNRRHKVGRKAWFAEISRDSAIVTPFYPVGGWLGSVNQAFPWVYGAGAPVLGCPRDLHENADSFEKSC